MLLFLDFTKLTKTHRRTDKIKLYLYAYDISNINCNVDYFRCMDTAQHRHY